jgi:type IV pilus assembly protein PilB
MNQETDRPAEGVQLPPAPFRLLGEEALAGAQVTAELLDGSQVHGALYRLDRSGRVGIERAADGKRLELTFGALRYLLFPPLPRRAAPSALPAPSARGFEVIYRDGRRLVGKTAGLIVDEKGLHLFRAERNEEIARLFVPAPAVQEYRVGERIGAALLTGQRLRENQLQAALETQQALRARKIGEYLKGGAAVSGEEIKAALERQAIYTSRKIGDLLVAEGLIGPQQLEAALSRQRHDRNKRLGDILVEMGAVTAEALHLTVARNLGIPFVKLQDLTVEPAVLGLVTVELARKNMLIPLLLQSGHLVVAMEDPLNIEALNLLRFTTGRAVDVVVATGSDIQWAIDRYYGPKGSAEALEELQLAEVEEETPERTVEDVERLGQEKPIVKLVSGVILDAVRQHASDIHIRATEDEVHLYFRIHGTLTKIATLNKRLLPAIVSRIKILSRMDIAERRLPQDGRARVLHAGAVVDLRISVIPTVYGESVVIRILDTRVGLKAIGELGFNEADQAVFTDLLHRSNGLFLVTGPTGSGKSTTLYAALAEVRRQNVNIITVEDPVEYHIDGIEQIQAYTAPDYSFARALRHILRHDPDVIMIGEIRDQETGRIAIESALTGHLVLSTLHTNDAASAVTRLMEMGVEPYLLSATLLGVLAQRLARRNCQHCMAVEAVEPAVRQTLGVAEDEVFYRGAGCEYCSRTGYGGRIAVYELLRVSEALRGLIVPEAAAAEIHRQAAAEGMTPLTEHALALARRRVIPLSEVYRVRLE